MQHPLESKTEYILKEVKAQFKNPCVLWAGGKDSTTLLYIIKLVFGKIIWPVVFIDTSFQFRETYNFIEMLKTSWNMKLIRAINIEALNKGVSPFTHSRFECCTKLKTDALKQIINRYSFDAVLVAIRWMEHGVRSKEEYFSLRRDPKHVRVHPMLHWTEDDVWHYIKWRDIPFNPLYKRIENGCKYRSIGCWPCTEPVPMILGRGHERDGRSQDKEELMERLRYLGYM